MPFAADPAWRRGTIAPTRELYSPPMQVRGDESAVNALQQLLSTRGGVDAATVLRALREGLADDPAASGPAHQLHRLLLGYFELDRMASDCGFSASFRRYPYTAAGLVAILDAEGEHQVAALMRSLISGRPLARGALMAGLREAGGMAARPGDGVRAALARFEATALADDASAAEIELGLGWSSLQEALLDRVQAASCTLAFSHGTAYRQALAREQQLNSLVEAHDIPALVRAMLEARQPRILARCTRWAIERAQAPSDMVEIAVTHRAATHPLGPAAHLPDSPAGRALRALYGCTNGAELFLPLGSASRGPGLVLVRDTEWEPMREQMRMWLRMGRDEHELPDWVGSLIPFAVTPGNASLWVMPLAGPLTGTVMRSNEDVPAAKPRYRSLAHFLAALRLFPHEVLGVAGHVCYLRDGSDHLLYPQGYREADAPV